MEYRRPLERAARRSVDDLSLTAKLSSAPLPSIAAVIPCHNSSESLELTLASLRDQDIPANEVICVDDNSGSLEANRQERLAHSYGAQYLRLPYDHRNRGRRSLARNAGTRQARAEVVLYVDSDMVLAPSYIASLRLIHGVHPRTLVKGTRIDVDKAFSSWPNEQEIRDRSLAVRPGAEYGAASSEPADTSSTPSPSPLSTGTRRDKHPICSGLYVSGHWDWCASNNLSVRRRHVVAVGGWDEHFVGWGEEDIELAYRLFLAGVEPVVQLSGPLTALHLNHVVDIDANMHSLEKNGLYFVRKFPEVLARRRLAYRQHGIVFDELEARR